MLKLTKQGLYCPSGDFYIDPSRGVDTAVITHAHSDHARRGSRSYLTAASGVSLLKARLGQNIPVRGYEFGDKFQIGPVKVSLHPAGHILGSAQVRMEYGGEVWVASGDYKRDFDPTCEPFQPVACDVFITEATFGTPSFAWPKKANLGRQIHEWWTANAERGVNSVLFAYSLGKAQRVLGVLYSETTDPIYCDPAVTELTNCYRDQGIDLAETICLSEVHDSKPLEGALFLVPQSFLKSERAEKLLGPRFETAFASGWMASNRGYGMNYDHGFVMSDHADFKDLVATVQETGARRVYVQHRGNGALVKHLKALGIDARPEDDLLGGSMEQLTLF